MATKWSLLVDKAEARSKGWHYFAYIEDSQGKPTDTTRPRDLTRLKLDLTKCLKARLANVVLLVFPDVLGFFHGFISVIVLTYLEGYRVKVIILVL